jgi:hypothetical protein
MAGFSSMGAQPEQPTEQAMPQDMQQAQSAPQAPQAGATGQASPEEQEQLDRFVHRAYEVMYKPETMQPLLQAMAGGDDPVDGLAEAAVSVVSRVNDAAEKAGAEIGIDVVMEAGREIIQELADLSTSAGIYDFHQDQDGLDGAFFRAIDMYRSEMQGAGKLDQATAQQDMAQIEQMSQSGEFEAILRQMAQQEEAA